MVRYFAQTVLLPFIVGFLLSSCTGVPKSIDSFQGSVIQGAKGKAPLTKKSKLTMVSSSLKDNVSRSGLSFDPESVYLFKAEPVYSAFSVEGRSIVELENSFARRLDVLNHRKSSTKTDMRLRYDIVCDGGKACDSSKISSCRFQNIEVWSSAEIMHPKLSSQTQICPYAGAVWKRFDEALREHEQGHLLNLEQTLLEFGKGLSGLNTDRKYKNCEDMKTVIEDLYAIQNLRLQVRELEYDIRTQRAEATGACFGSYCEGYDRDQDKSCR